MNVTKVSMVFGPVNRLRLFMDLFTSKSYSSFGSYAPSPSTPVLENKFLALPAVPPSCKLSNVSVNIRSIRTRYHTYKRTYIYRLHSDTGAAYSILTERTVYSPAVATGARVGMRKGSSLWYYVRVITLVLRPPAK